MNSADRRSINEIERRSPGGGLISDSRLVQARRFAGEILPQVSRTFDLAIKFLPRKLSRPVGLAYLLCRIADSFEDSTQLPPEIRSSLLEKYSRLLKVSGDYDQELLAELQNAFASTGHETAAAQSDNPANLRLVKNLDKVLVVVDSLPPEFKKRIYPRVQEMATGMAQYTLMVSARPSQVSFLKDEEDWDRYCYYVAGTVGHMLTDIFCDYAGFGRDMRRRLHALGRSFGLGLQKVNILKDAVIDSGRGICFLPKTIVDRYGVMFGGDRADSVRGDLAGLVRKVIEICRSHFEDAIEYIRMIPIKHLGLRMFLIVPVMLAAATLRLFNEYPGRLLERGDLKLSRTQVLGIVRRSAFCRYSNHMLRLAFNRTYPG